MNVNPLIDTHCHLDFPEFANDLDAVIKRATAAGVDRIITIGTSLDSSRAAIELANRYPNVFATVGLHPTSITEDTPEFIEELKQLAEHPKAVAIGECGLDFYRLSDDDKPDLVESAFGSITQSGIETDLRIDSLKAAQGAAFEQQLELAAQLGKPVVIHQRDSWNETLEIIKPYSVNAVFHCFTGGLAELKEVLALGYHVSFTGIATFKNATDVRAAAKAVPSDRVMVETDAPYLAPVPHRGKRCEPAYVRFTAESIARERGVSPDDFAKTTTDNAERFFGLLS
ncbi:MAG: TatD family hydrolase [Chthoniobacterales bacterium]